MKYPTLQALAEAFTDGDLPRENKVVVDNDSITAYDEHDTCVFDMHPNEVLEQAMGLLGIPWTLA